MKPQTNASGGDHPAKSQSTAAAAAGRPAAAATANAPTATPATVTVMPTAAPAKSANAGIANTTVGDTVANLAGGSVAASANAGNTDTVAIAGTANTVANATGIANAIADTVATTDTVAPPLELGIDVAKAELVVALRDGGRARRTDAYANSKTGIARLLRRAAKDAGGREVRACLESTAGYEAAAAHALFETGHAVAVVQPKRIADFAQSAMRRNKTDAADAAAIAEFMQRMQPRLWRPRSASRETLRQLANAHDALVQQEGDAVRRLKSPRCAGAAAAIWRANRDFARRQLARVQAEAEAVIAADAELAAQARLLRSIPGVGPVVATAVLGYIDFAQFDNAGQVAAYIGVCPSRRQSGAGPGRARLSKRGQSLVRRALFMAALSASRHNPAIRQVVGRLQSADSKGDGRALTPKQANCAAMHKLARQMFGVVKNNRPYQADWADQHHANTAAAGTTAAGTVGTATSADAGAGAAGVATTVDAGADVGDAGVAMTADAGADVGAMPSQTVANTGPNQPLAA